VNSNHIFDMDDGTTITISFSDPMIGVKCEKGGEWLWGTSAHRQQAISHSKMSAEQRLALIKFAFRPSGC
jgi:hypothetical protein